MGGAKDKEARRRANFFTGITTTAIQRGSEKQKQPNNPNVKSINQAAAEPDIIKQARTFGCGLFLFLSLLRRRRKSSNR